MKLKKAILSLLLLGVVDQIENDIVTIEYERNGKTFYSTVSLTKSSCVPTEGQKVYFYEGYKIVSCEKT